MTYRVVHGAVDVDGVDPRLAALIQACVAGEPGARPSPAEIIARCAVTSALVDDPVYRALVGTDGSAQPPLGYVPTLVPGAGTPPAAPHRSRAKLYLGAGAVAVALGVIAALTVQELDGGDEDKNRGNVAASPRPSLTSAPAASAPGPASGAEPAFIEATNPNRDYWAPADGGGGACGLPAEERAGRADLQAAIVSDEDPSAQRMSGKVKISFRFKYADPDLGRPYYVSVAVKPPHEIDSKTGKPYAGLVQQNLGLGYTSKPVDLLKPDTPSFGAPYVDLTYPDDFQQVVMGKPVGSAIPVGNDPGNWTVLFYHVKSPKEYASIDCRGFVAR